jgi:tetrahydromethanopterin S-methyltransferase subunit B
MLGTIRSLGANFGVAFTGTLIADTQSQVMLQKIASNEATASLPTGFVDGLVHSMQPAIDALQRLPEPTQQFVNTYFNESYLYAFSMANAVDAALGAIGLFGVLVWFKNKKV